MKNQGFSWIRSTYFFQYAGFGVFVVYLSLYYKRLGLSNDQIGVLAAVYPLVGLALNPVCGHIYIKLKFPINYRPSGGLLAFSYQEMEIPILSI